MSWLAGSTASHLPWNNLIAPACGKLLRRERSAVGKRVQERPFHASARLLWDRVSDWRLPGSLQKKEEAAEYHKLLMARLKEERERRSESLAKKRAIRQASVASKEATS